MKKLLVIMLFSLSYLINASQNDEDDGFSGEEFKSSLELKCKNDLKRECYSNQVDQLSKFHDLIDKAQYRSEAQEKALQKLLQIKKAQIAQEKYSFLAPFITFFYPVCIDESQLKFQNYDAELFDFVKKDLECKACATKKYDESQSVSFQSKLKDNRCKIISTSATKDGFTHYSVCETEKNNLTFPDLLYKKDSRSPLQDENCSVIYGLKYKSWKSSSPIKCWAGWKKYSGVQVLVAQKGPLTVEQEDYYVNFVNRRKIQDDASAAKLTLYQTALKKGTIDHSSQIQVFSKIDSKVTEEIIDNKKGYRLDLQKAWQTGEKSPAQALFDRLS